MEREPGGAGWRPAPAGLDASQHARQVGGWEESLAVLRGALRSPGGNFDGIMGFSQVGRPPSLALYAPV